MADFFIDSWDSGQAGATWDSGLQWDVNIGNSTGDVTPYLDLVTSEHRNQPNYISILTSLLQGPCDLQVNMSLIPGLLDIDVAIGDQLDKVGEWIGATREVSVALTGVYFSLGIEGLGLGQGSMQGPNDPTSGLVTLPDSGYRTLLRAKIAANHWDGSIPGAYAAWDIAFSGTGFSIGIIDLGGMHMIYVLFGGVPDALTLGLFTGGLLDLKPAGVMIDLYITPSASNVPYFGLGPQSANIGGLGVGYFGIESPGA